MIDMSIYVNLLSEPVMTKIFGEDLELSKMWARGLFDANFSTIKQFTIDDALACRDTLLLILILFPVEMLSVA